MSCRSARRVAAFAVLVAAFGSLVAGATTAHADVTSQTPVMGPNLLTADQLATWYWKHHGSNVPHLPALNDDVHALAQIFIDEGRTDGVRGDIAFVQSMLETGWLSFTGSQIPPDANNYAGIYAFNGRSALPTCAFGDSSPSRCFPSPNIGARTQIQLLRSYADPTAKTLSGRLISAPSDRAGMAPLWEYFGGTNCPCGKLIWASAPDYGLYIIKMYSQALVESGANPACVPYAPGDSSTKSGNGYWLVTSDSAVVPFGTAHFYGDPTGLPLNAPLVGGASIPGATGYWLIAGDGGIFSYGAAQFYGSTGGMRLNQPVIGMQRTQSGHGYWLFARDGGVFSFGDAPFFGSLGGVAIPAPIVAGQRTASGAGYVMLGADGRVYPFGDAANLGDIAGCSNYGGARGLLFSPTGNGYWIATTDGSIIPFGDARRLGFPVRVAGPPVALMGAG